MRRIIAIVCLSLLCSSPVFAAATRGPATNNYEIEVLIFEVKQPELEGSEVWTRDGTRPIDTSGAIPAGAAPVATELSATAAALRGDGRYRVLLHKRWAQNAEAKSSARPVLLSSGDKELDGTLKFYLSRFLHVELALAFQPALTQASTEGTSQYQINEQRRIKTQELHYFDHPKFGALVRISPQRTTTR